MKTLTVTEWCLVLQSFSIYILLPILGTWFAMFKLKSWKPGIPDVSLTGTVNELRGQVNQMQLQVDNHSEAITQVALKVDPTSAPLVK